MKRGTTIGWKRCLTMYARSFYPSIPRTTPPLNPPIMTILAPTLEVQKFFDLLKVVKEPLHEHKKVIVLVFVTRLMAIKSKFAFANNFYK
jgi:hypothetical protein